MSVPLLASVLLQSGNLPDLPIVALPNVDSGASECCVAGPLGGNLALRPESAADATAPLPLLTPAAVSAPAAEAAVAGPPEPAVAGAQAEEPAPSNDPYSFRLFGKQAASIPWRFGGAFAAISIGGFSKWNWGSSSFRFNSEGWFGKDTASMGMDKLGHAYSAYVLTEFFSDGIKKRSPDDRSGLYTSAILAMGLMTYIEVFDGFSGDHGFSHEDLVVDAAGALFSVARRAVPGLRDKVDFRLLYVPSDNTWRALSCFPEPHCDQDGATVRGPFTDYTAQRYLLAFKLSGFEALQRTPLRLLELHAGYYARGFTQEEEERGDPLKRRLFVGLGLNVGELLFPGRRRGVAGIAKWALQYLQVPYTAVHSN